MKNLVFVILIMLASCNASKNIDNQKNSNEDICESMTYNTQSVVDISSDYYSVDTLFINNNCLNIWVSYGGGCGDANFTMYYTDVIDNLEQPSTSLRLQLFDDDDCRAVVQQKLYYNLSFFDEYAEKEGIIFNVVGYDKKILYLNK